MLHKKDLQAPFRDRDLLSVSQFIKFCQKHGLRVSRYDLEFYDKLGLVMPAIRINRGVNEHLKVLIPTNDVHEWKHIHKKDEKEFKCKKIKKKIYYMSGGISHQDELDGSSWLEWYKKRSMLLYPAKERFKSWKSLEPKDGNFVGDYKKAISFSDYYSPYQFYAVAEIHNQYKLISKNDVLVQLSKQDIPRNKEFFSRFKKRGIEQNLARNRIFDLYKFFALIRDIEAFFEKHNSELKNQFNIFVEENEDNISEAKKDLTAYIEQKNKTVLPVEAKNVFDKHCFTIDDINNWKVFFLKHGTFDIFQGQKITKKYALHLSHKVLVNAEHPYKIIDRLNWFMKLLGEKVLDVQQMLLQCQFSTCPYCQNTYEKKRKDQKNCLAKECQKEHGREIKRQGRKKGIYK